MATETMESIRPGLAKLAVYCALMYLIGFELLRVFMPVDGPSSEVAALILSPAGVWMVGRTVDGFSPKGKTTNAG